MADEKTLQKWLKDLGGALDKQIRSVREFTDYYDGKHPLRYATDKYERVFGDLFKAFSDNFCSVVVDSVEERLTIDGFRIPFEKPRVRRAEGEQDDQPGAADDEATRIWQSNYLDADSQLGHTEALTCGIAYGLVWNNPADENTPAITIESPSQMIVAQEAGNRRRLRAGLKRWKGDDDFLYATLYLPDGIYKFRSRTKRSAGDSGYGVGWVAREVADENWPLENPLGRVPIVPLVNRTRLDGAGRSELISVIPLQNALNKLFADMLIASEFAAFRQKWATGIEIPEDPDNPGEPIEDFETALNRLWSTANEQAKFGDFAETDLSNYVKAIETTIQHLASQTRTPAHYFMAGMGSFPSGESLKASETGLVAKARQRMRHFGEAWEDIIRLAFQVIGDDARANAVGAETIWRDPESRSDAELVDAAVKLHTIGVPVEALWERIGATPGQISRWRVMQEQESLRLGAFPQLPLPAPEAQPDPDAIQA